MNGPLGMVGLGSDQAYKMARKGYKKVLQKEETLKGLPYSDKKRIMLEFVQHLPPETKAFLLFQAITSLVPSIFQNQTLAFALETGVGEDDGKELKTALMDVLDRVIEHMRAMGHKLAEEVALRVADGFPEWDFENGCPVGRENEPQSMSTDELAALFEGLDWGDE